MTRQLTFLIGAHKTATTHLQRGLGRAKAALAETGLAVVGPRAIGADLLPFADLAGGRTSADLLHMVAETFLSREAGTASQVLLMNENAMGGLHPRPLLRDNLLYGQVPGRLSRLASLFPGHRLRFGLAIRNPASFLVSAWGEDMKGGRFQPFAKYLGKADPARLSWAGLVEAIRKAVPEVPLTIWRYEDYPANARPLLDHLTGGHGALVRLKEARLNSGLSARAVALLRDSGDTSRDAFRAAKDRFPKSGVNPGFDPWTPVQTAAIAARYDADCARIAALPGVTWITP